VKTMLDVDELVFSPPELGCVLYLLGLPGGGSKIYDRSPYGIGGTITGAVWKLSEGGVWCLDFDGTDDYVNLGTDSRLAFTTAFTLKLWVNLDTVSQTACPYARGWSYSAKKGMRILVVTGGKWYLQLGDGSNRPAAVSDDNATVGWTHLVATFSGGVGKLYRQGIVQAGTLSLTSIVYQDNDAYLGAGETPTDSNMDGKIALVELSSNVWTDQQIADSFDREKYLFGVW